MRHKILGYFVIATFIYNAISVIVTKQLPTNRPDPLDAPLPLALMVGGFFLYVAYILWDNELR